MKISADGEKLLVGDYQGRLKLISARDGELIKDFGRVHDYAITGIVITVDQKFWFTCSTNGELKQWNYGDNTLVRDHGNINDLICSLCL